MTSNIKVGNECNDINNRSWKSDKKLLSYWYVLAHDFQQRVNRLEQLPHVLNFLILLFKNDHAGLFIARMEFD